MCRLRTASFWTRWQGLIYTNCMLGFIGLDKPSRSITTSSNRTSLLRGGLLEGEWGSTGWRPGQASLGAKTSYRKQGPNFDLVGTSQTVVVSETLGPLVRHIGQILPIHGVYRFESSRYSRIWVIACPLLSSYSMSGVLLLIRGWGWLWLYFYHDDYYITLLMTLTFVNVLLVYACYNL
jgi:hypothetical protein